MAPSLLATPTHCGVIPRVLFGSNHLYVFHHPQELSYLAKTGEQPKPVTYDSAQGEIAAGSGFDMTTEGKSKGHYNSFYHPVHVRNYLSFSFS